MLSIMPANSRLSDQPISGAIACAAPNASADDECGAPGVVLARDRALSQRDGEGISRETEGEKDQRDDMGGG